MATPADIAEQIGSQGKSTTDLAIALANAVDGGDFTAQELQAALSDGSVRDSYFDNLQDYKEANFVVRYTTAFPDHDIKGTVTKAWMQEKCNMSEQHLRAVVINPSHLQEQERAYNDASLLVVDEQGLEQLRDVGYVGPL